MKRKRSKAAIRIGYKLIRPNGRGIKVTHVKYVPNKWITPGSRNGPLCLYKDYETAISVVLQLNWKHYEIWRCQYTPWRKPFKRVRGRLAYLWYYTKYGNLKYSNYVTFINVLLASRVKLVELMFAR